MLKNTVNVNEVLFNKHSIYDTNVIIRIYHYTYSLYIPTNDDTVQFT